MVRSTFAWTVVTLATLTSGCRMCASPYDYCGPIFTGGDCQQCMPNFREGSILSPAAPLVSGPEIVPGMMAPVPDAEMVGAVPEIKQPVETAAAAASQGQAVSRPARLR
jgi:hypothetical protein